MNLETELPVEKYFFKILDLLFDGVYITNSRGITIWVNSAYENMTGLKRENLIGRSVIDLMQEGVFNIALNPIIVKTGKPHTAVQIFKSNRKFILNGYPIFNTKGQVAYVVTYVRDVTILSQLKEQISQQAELIEKYHQETSFLREINLHEEDIVIKSPCMFKLMELINRIATTDTTVLILGETGVGKEIFARKIHLLSPRSSGPYFKINCAAIPEHLLESELFGYEPGAFSGAHPKGKPGYFEIADGGTLFLDEIGELSLSIQAKLLRVIQDQEFMRLGSTKVRHVNVRLIAATNQNLEDAVKEGRFRRDLYYRLKVAVIEIPPLRERKEDILPLINHFLKKFNTKYHKNVYFSQEALQLLIDYRWPGNVRELENLIQSLIVTRDKDRIEASDLPNYILDSNDFKERFINNAYQPNKSLAEIIDEFEKELLKKAFQIHGSISAVAKSLQVDRSTIFRKMKKYGLI